MKTKKLQELYKMYQDAGHHKKMLQLFLLIVVTVIMELILVTYITKKIINIEIPNQNIKGILTYSALYIIIILIQSYMVLKHCNMRCILERIMQGELREKVFNKLQKVNTKFYDENESGTILQFMQNDTNEAGRLFPDIIVEMYFMGVIRFLIIAFFMMFIDLKVTLLIVGLYIIGYTVTVYFNRKTIKEIYEIRKTSIEIYTLINEGIQGFLTIKTLEIIDNKIQELEARLNEFVSENKKVEKIVATYNSIFTYITSFSIPLIIYFSGNNIVKGLASYAEIMLLIDYSGNLGYEFNWFIRHLTGFNKAFVSYSKILKFLEIENVEEIDNGQELKEINSIEFRNVNFSYNDNQKTIKNFNLKINQNDKIALVGKTGSGKSTITNLLCRFYEPNNGKILINGSDYKEYSIASLRNNIGYIMQDVQILPHTIIDNIRYVNKNIKEEEIKNIFKRLKLHDKIMTLEDGYNTNIFDNPDVLSTGEKQLINFARIMAINPDLIILDEATSNLSNNTEMLVKNAIEEVTKEKISIIIAHRLETTKLCNKIITMQDGMIV
ncbi:MAG: ABC transporter ATP-binding protein [Clostridia bacterium]|nr:ABC transporter ATP-binding protein [Clostridia bacterium]